MQRMAAPLKHLIAPAPTEEREFVPASAPCRVADALAGDCSTSLGERLRAVEAECGFGQRCGRGCHGLPPPDCGFVGKGRITVGWIANPGAPDGTGNAQRFAPTDPPERAGSGAHAGSTLI